jgi:predicted nicotinamide N-methyase
MFFAVCVSDTPRPNEVYTFQTPNGPIQITIKESFMKDVHATGFRTWSSAVHLSKRLLGHPRAFFPKISFEGTQVLRVLELGSGTGLAGIAAYRALEQASIPTCVTLSDMDDSTLSTLRMNVTDNGISFEGDCNNKIRAAKLDWTAINIDKLGSFDVILGADIVYEPEHAELIHGVVSKLLQQEPSSIFHLMVVLRPTHESDMKALEQVFFSRPNEVDAGYLNITYCETIEATEKDDYPYPHRYYKIQWANF